ncbi:MAG: hypothetical protein AAB964_01845, partial [Patescibacteria group bacterium]
GEVRVTVIATGFPAPGGTPRGTPLFSSFPTREGGKEDVAPLGKIFNAPSAPKEKEKEEPKPEPAAAKSKEDDDDDWGAVPSFLRRPKMK